MREPIIKSRSFEVNGFILRKNTGSGQDVSPDDDRDAGKAIA